MSGADTLKGPRSGAVWARMLPGRSTLALLGLLAGLLAFVEAIRPER